MKYFFADQLKTWFDNAKMAGSDETLKEYIENWFDDNKNIWNTFTNPNNWELDGEDTGAEDILEDFDPFSAGEKFNNVINSLSQENMENSIIRYFYPTDNDNFRLTVITDPTDTKVLLWDLNED